jgi:subtilisin family serine protease
LANNAYALTIGDCLKQSSRLCIYSVNKITVSNIVDTNTSASTINTLLGNLGQNIFGRIVPITWTAIKNSTNKPLIATDYSVYTIRYGCGYSLNIEKDTNKIVDTKLNFALWNIPQNIPECSDRTKDCYCKIWVWILDSKGTVVGGSNTRPFSIYTTNPVVGSVKLYNPPQYAKEGKDFESKSVLLKLKSTFNIENMSASQIQAYFSKYNLKYIDKVGFINVIRLRSGDKNVTNIMQLLANDPMIEYIEPNYFSKINYTPNDSGYSFQYSLNNTGVLSWVKPDKSTIEFPAKKDADMDVAEAWDEYNPTKNIVVSVIDTGVPYNNLGDINYWDGNSCWAPNGATTCPNHGWDTFNNDNDPGNARNHGLEVASVIGAITDNKLGIAGMSTKNNIKIMIVKTGKDSVGDPEKDKDENIDTMSIIKGIEFTSKNNVKIINLSSTIPVKVKAYEDAVMSFIKNGGIIFNASGNKSMQLGVDVVDMPIEFDKNNNSVKWEKVTYHQYPCDYDIEEVVCVGATDPLDNLSKISNYGKTVDVGAPGESILVLSGYDTQAKELLYSVVDGTSVATPNVAGVAALVWSQKTNLTNTELAKLIKQSGDSLSSLQGKVNTGKRVNAYRALTGKEPPGEENNDCLKITYPNGGEKFKTGDKVEIKWDANKDKKGQLTLKISDDISGKTVDLTKIDSDKLSYEFTIDDKLLNDLSPTDKKGNKYKIKGDVQITGNTEKCEDESDGYFSINQDTNPDLKFRLIAPNGGEKFKTGDKVEIKWEKGPYKNEKVIAIGIADYQSGQEMLAFINKRVDNNGSYIFEITDDILSKISGAKKSGDKYKIFILAYDSSQPPPEAVFINSLNDYSDDFFSINFTPDDGKPSISKPLVVSESAYIDYSNNQAIFKAGIYVGQKTFKVSYFFKTYIKDKANKIVPGSEMTLNAKEQFETGVGKNHIVSLTRDNIQKDTTYCFVPYAAFEPITEDSTGKGEEVCYPGFPWVTTKTATDIKYNNQQGSADSQLTAILNGIITYFAKSEELKAYFSYYPKGDETNVTQTAGKKYKKPTTGSQRTNFSEPLEIKDLNAQYCYKACVEDTKDKNILSCGQEMCFAEMNLGVRTLSSSKIVDSQTGIINSEFRGRLENYKRNVYGSLGNQLTPMFLIYPQGESKDALYLKWNSVKLQTDSRQEVFPDASVVDFIIKSKISNFDTACLCYKALMYDNISKKMYSASNEVCGKCIVGLNN